jgi:chromosome segregation protein
VGERQEEAKAELESIAEQIAAADEQAEVLAAQAEEQAGSCPTLEDAVRAAQGQQQRAAQLVAQVQQQIQVLAAESRSVDEQPRQLRAPRAPGRRRRPRRRPTCNGWTRSSARPRPPTRPRHRRGRLHELSEQVPALDEQRRAGAGQRQPRGRQAGRPGARLDALRALQEKVQTEGKLKPWLARTAWTACRACGPGAHRARLGDGAGSGAARAPERAGGGPAGHRARLRRRRAAGQAGLLHRAGRPAPDTHHTLPRLADLLRLGDAGLKALLATGWKASTPPPAWTTRWRSAPS